MIKVSVMYPAGDGSRFDMDYYLGTHIPLVRRTLGPALKGVAVDEGLAGGAPGTPPAYLAVGHLLFESVETFQEAFAPHAGTITGDVPNYTNVEPVLQISDVKL